jgi:hypothetical protein
VKALLFFLGWCLLSVAYGFLALMTVGILFGREAGANHLIGLAAAFALWVTATFFAVRLRGPRAT